MKTRKSRYEAEKSASDGKWQVIKLEWTPDCGIMSDIVKTAITGDLAKWNAEYFAAYLNYRLQSDASFVLNTDKDIEPTVSLDMLAFDYCKDSFGVCRGVQNADKLMTDFMIDMQLKGAGFRFGFLGCKANKQEVFNKLRANVQKVVDMYGVAHG